MNLNKDVKAKLALALVAEASKKQAKATVKTAQRIQAGFRAGALAMAQRHIPELSHDRILELIRDGVLVSHKSATSCGEMYVTVPKLNDKFRKTEAPLMGSCEKGIGRDKREYWTKLISAVEQNWGGLDMIKVKTDYGTLRLYWLAGFADVPAFPDAKYLYDGVVNDKATPLSEAWNVVALPLAKQAQKITELFLQVLTEADEYHQMVTGILDGIRTLKQLEDQFPEAIKFLPTELRKEKGKAVAPTELINRAREMLITGIPN